MTKKKSLEWQNCSEDSLPATISGFVAEFCIPGTLLLLEGELGAGKSFFARTLIRQLSKTSQSQGSPTFPLVQEYRADAGFPIYHMDLYRLRSEEEVFHSGISEQIDSRDALVLVEWGSLFPGIFPTGSGIAALRSVFKIEIEGRGDFRNYKVQRL
jgi:tRNA threonylcarbamoyl adenosine modification protein YjeE